GACLRVMDGHTYHVQCLAWAADQRRALSCSREIRLWDLDTGRCLESFGLTDTIRTIAWSVDQQHALSASHDGTVRVWDVATGRCLRTFEGHTTCVVNAVWTADQRQIISCD